MYQERARLDSTPIARCPCAGEWVPLSDSAEHLATAQAEYERLRKLPYDELVKLRREVLGLRLSRHRVQRAPSASVVPEADA